MSVSSIFLSPSIHYFVERKTNLNWLLRNDFKSDTACNRDRRQLTGLEVLDSILFSKMLFLQIQVDRVLNINAEITQIITLLPILFILWLQMEIIKTVVKFNFRLNISRDHKKIFILSFWLTKLFLLLTTKSEMRHPIGSKRFYRTLYHDVDLPNNGYLIYF